MTQESNGDLTQDENPDSILTVILSRMEMLVERFGRLEDSNLRIEAQLKTFHHQLKEMAPDLMEVRTAQRDLRKRLTALERLQS